MYFELASPAIVESSIDFGKAAEYAKKAWPTIPGLLKTRHCWEGSTLHFLTENIQPTSINSKKPKVMLLFSNPHPDSVQQGLFMSESHSRGFWKILSNCMQPKWNHEFQWNKSGISDTVSILISGKYESPLMFFECLYQLPSESPEDLKRIFDRKTDDFQIYLHKPNLKRISAIINMYNINVVLIFTQETYNSVVDKPKISKGSREVLRTCVEKDTNDAHFWEYLEERGLKDQVRLWGLSHDCTAIKIMDTYVKNRWFFKGSSIFSHVLCRGLRYAAEFG
ncbi:hypothetical protein ACFLWR_04850 [Chloroflexota bacterium]